MTGPIVILTGRIRYRRNSNCTCDRAQQSKHHGFTAAGIVLTADNPLVERRLISCMRSLKKHLRISEEALMALLFRMLCLAFGLLVVTVGVSQSPSAPHQSQGKTQHPLTDAYPTDTEEPGDPRWVRDGTAAPTSPQATDRPASTAQAPLQVSTPPASPPAPAAAAETVPPNTTVPQTSPPVITGPRLPPADVLLDDQPVFSINARLGQYAPAD